MSTILKITDLHKSYGSRRTLKNINLTVDSGEILGVIGVNGAGKTTLIKCIINLLSFEVGTILVDGLDVTTQHREITKIIGYVPDHDISYNQMTGNEYLEFIAAVYQVAPNNYQRRRNEYAEKLQIGAALNTLIASYSHGMKQKIGLIASIIHEPKLWILDEPIVGLDYYSVNSLIGMIKEYNAHGNTILLSSHNLDIVKKICRKYVVMRSGNLSEISDMNALLTENDLFKLQKGEDPC